jgi:hypothetical protein
VIDAGLRLHGLGRLEEAAQEWAAILVWLDEHGLQADSGWPASERARVRGELDRR